MLRYASGDSELRRTVLAEAQGRLDAALAGLTPYLPPQDDGPRQANCPSGEPYVVIRTGDEGHATADDAIEAWREKVLPYVSQRRKGSLDMLWWRIRPEIDAQILDGTNALLWHVYSRLALTHDVVTEAPLHA